MEKRFDAGVVCVKNMKKNILSLSAKEARDFFLKEKSYFSTDLPPYFQFENLLKKISSQLEGKNLSDFYSQNLKPKSCDDVNYKLVSNKDGKYAWRPLQLIHPALYVDLVFKITEDDSWKYITDRINFLIKNSPKIVCASMPVVSSYFKKNTSAQIIQWIDEVEKKSIVQSLDYDYLFHTDITDCYGSIYTHSIPWALHDRDVAKNNQCNNSLIGNVIDWQIQSMSNGQTNGIPQGSVLMDFLAEIVLCYIDSLLAINISNLNDYHIIRYRDDYRIFTNNPQIADQIIKELTHILHSFGLRINSGKTNGANNVIRSSIKLDKLYWIAHHSEQDNLQNELYAISEFANQFVDSGTIVGLLVNFFDKISKLSKTGMSANVMVLISMVADIASKNPKTYAISSAIMSVLIDFLPTENRREVANKILIKFNKLPNSGIMHLWLQRITIKLNGNYSYSENLCKRVENDCVILWNSDWLNDNLKDLINNYKIVNREELDKLGAIIKGNEVKLFSILNYQS